MKANRCDDYRVALSARLDGEPATIDSDEVAAHVAGCSDCTAFLRAAEELKSVFRVSPPAPDLTVQILAAVAAEERAAARASAAAAQQGERRQILRVALGISAVVQLALAIPALFITAIALAHTSREAASFDIALAVGFALAAWKPERARAFVPVAFVLAGCLTLTSVFDMAAGATAIAHEVGHVAALAQAALLWALSRQASQTTSAKPATVAQ